MCVKYQYGDSLRLLIVIMMMGMVCLFSGNADFSDRYPVTRKWCNAPTKMAQPGDILISVRAPIGAINYAKESAALVGLQSADTR